MLLMASARSRITVNSMYAKVSAISYDWLKNDMVVVKELFYSVAYYMESSIRTVGGR